MNMQCTLCKNYKKLTNKADIQILIAFYAHVWLVLKVMFILHNFVCKPHIVKKSFLVLFLFMLHHNVQFVHILSFYWKRTNTQPKNRISLNTLDS